MKKAATYEPSIQAATKTLDVSWQAEDIGAAAARAAAGACGLVESQMKSLPSYPAENRDACNGRLAMGGRRREVGDGRLAARVRMGKGEADLPQPLQSRRGAFVTV
jgi:hypothetical protein